MNKVLDNALYTSQALAGNRGPNELSTNSDQYNSEIRHLASFDVSPKNPNVITNAQGPQLISNSFNTNRNINNNSKVLSTTQGGANNQPGALRFRRQFIANK